MKYITYFIQKKKKCRINTALFVFSIIFIIFVVEKQNRYNMCFKKKKEIPVENETKFPFPADWTIGGYEDPMDVFWDFWD